MAMMNGDDGYCCRFLDPRHLTLEMTGTQHTPRSGCLMLRVRVD